MEYNKQFYLFLFLITIITKGSGQSTEPTHLHEYFPPSPTAKEFIKYGEYPVGMYTGVPSIAIPLHTIKVNDISSPISISYHSSGIQVDQVASWVGLGWSLQGGGSISKVTHGIPDDVQNGFLRYNVPELADIGLDFDFYDQSAIGERDTESDIYHYNFAGYSGKFYFDRGKNIRLIEEVPIQITYQNGDFMIITKEGVKYEFNFPETTSSKTFGDNQTLSYTSTWHLTKITSANKIDTITFDYHQESSFSTYQYNYSESYAIGSQPSFSSLGLHEIGKLESQTSITNRPTRLKEIIFPNGKIIFNTINDRLDIVPDRLQEVEIYKKNGITYNKIKSYEFIHDYFYSSHTNLFPIVNPNEARRHRLKLTGLYEYGSTTNTPKKHTFEYNNTMLPPIESNGKDYWGYYNGKNTNYTLIPKQEFQILGNDVGSADRNPDEAFMQAGILNKITYPTGGYTDFFYEPHQYVTTEPNIITRTIAAFAVGEEGVIGNGTPYEDIAVFTPNYSGYATVSIEASDLSSPTGTFPKITLQKDGDSNYIINHSIDPTTYSYPLNPPKVEKTFSPVWLDKGVTYTLKSEATGSSSSTEYDGAAYMRAQISYKEELASTTPVTKIAGGLRIQQIKSYSKNDVLAISKKYEYKGSTLITPEFFLKEHFVPLEVFYSSGPGVGCPGVTGFKRKFASGGTVRTLTKNGGSPVVYSSVDELIVDHNNNDIGKTNYQYDIVQDQVFPVPLAHKGGIMVLKKDWMGGQIKSKKMYPKNWSINNDNSISEENNYILKKHNEIESYKMYKIMPFAKIVGASTTCLLELPKLMSNYHIFEYPIYTGAKLLSTTQKITRYGTGKEITTNSSIFYDNDTHLQPTRTETITSDGKTITTKTYYPDDITSVNSLIGSENLLPEELEAIEQLKSNSQHRVAEPIQIETTIDGAKTIQRTNYKTWIDSGLTLPEFLQTSKNSNTLENRINYRSYDDNGNPMEVSKVNGSVTSYIWGYNKQFPIAKIENAAYVEIASILNITPAVLKGYNESNLTQINNLRSLLPKAFITTYTYTPMIGVSSITDTKGYTMFYHYDDFNRLKEVRDMDNLLITDYKYNYKNN